MIRPRLAGVADALRAHRVLVGIAISAALFGLLALSAAVLPQTASASGDGKITAFDVDVTITPAGDVEVVETIAYDLGAEPRHGLTRVLPGADEVEGVSAAALDSPVPVHTDAAGDETIVRIGDFDGAPTLSGEHTFQISYTYAGMLVDQGGEVGYYADIVGSEWDVPIERTTVEVTMPQSVFVSGVGDVLDVWCYAGDVGTRNQCDTTVAGVPVEDDMPLSFAHGRLKPGQVMSVGVTFTDYTCSETSTATVCGSKALKTWATSPG